MRVKLTNGIGKIWRRVTECSGRGGGASVAGILLISLIHPTALGWAAERSSANRVLAGPVAARVIRVLDGDTLIVQARIWLGQVVETKVRLTGIDTPELRGKCADEKQRAAAARAFVEGQVAHAEVILTDVHYGKFAGRVLARVRTPAGHDLGEILIAQGLGRAYMGGRRAGWCG